MFILNLEFDSMIGSFKMQYILRILFVMAVGLLISTLHSMTCVNFLFLFHNLLVYFICNFSN